MQNLAVLEAFIYVKEVSCRELCPLRLRLGILWLQKTCGSMPMPVGSLLEIEQ